MLRYEMYRPLGLQLNILQNGRMASRARICCVCKYTHDEILTPHVTTFLSSIINKNISIVVVLFCYYGLGSVITSRQFQFHFFVSTHSYTLICICTPHIFLYKSVYLMHLREDTSKLNSTSKAPAGGYIDVTLEYRDGIPYFRSLWLQDYFIRTPSSLWLRDSLSSSSLKVTLTLLDRLPVQENRGLGS